MGSGYEVGGVKLEAKNLLGLIRKAGKVLAKMQKAFESLDKKNYDQSELILNESIRQISQEWSSLRRETGSRFGSNVADVGSPEYAHQVEKFLKASNIPLKGHYPSYLFPPFTLEFSPEKDHAKLQMGRKSEKTTALAPEALANWIGTRYRKVVDRPFDSKTVAGNLLKAYEVVNRLAYRSERVRWGHAVPLGEIYKLLTLSRSSRQEYSEGQFIGSSYMLGVINSGKPPQQ
ncbi:MAG: hypothetical protein GHCLOJNM_03527 [bacterium]|nr:hypothetical protein [bacterium]